MEIVYPPVGIVHITRQIPDLIADRTEHATAIRVAVAMQPKAAPHFGTGIVIMSAFAIAALMSEAFSLPASVLLDMLDNAPADTVVIDGIEYTTCLSHADAGDGGTLAEVNTAPVRRLAEWASRRSAVPFTLRTYTAIQAQPGFRDGLAQVLTRPCEFEPLFSPSGRRLRVRPVCSHCGMVDKTARTVTIRHVDPLTITFTCGRDGRQDARIDDPSAVFDANTPIRTVLRSLCFARDRRVGGIETVVLNGGDWAGEWMQRVYFDGLHALGCDGTDAPFNLFTPQILDDSAAKLSKTIYLTAGRYANVDPAWTSMRAYEERFGSQGLQALWDEVTGWTQAPEKFFRNYSVRYLEHVLGTAAATHQPSVA
jgi:hypothetical protein